MATTEWKSLTFSSGVAVRYGPFPSGLYWDIMALALDEHPDPEPPKKAIKVVDGEEMVDDPDDPQYQAELGKARLARWNLLGEAVLEFCVEPEGGMEQHEPTVARLAEHYVKDAPPSDPVGRKVWFLTKFAIRTAEDWKVVGKVQRFSQIEDDEVRQRAEFFRGDVAGTEGDGADAPGAAEA